MANFRWAVFAALGVIFSACYMLWLYQRAFLGQAGHDVEHHMSDLTPREMIAIGPMILMMVWMGIGTGTFLRPISTANAQILELSRVNLEERVRTTAPLAAGVARTEAGNAR